MENDQSLPAAPAGNGSSAAQSSEERTFLLTCPYLGTLEDPETAMSYPAAGNHCYRLRSPASVELTHQEAFCLTERHTSCAIFKQAVGASEEPRAAAAPAAPEPEKKPKQRVSLLALPIILLLLLAAAIIWWPEPGATIQEALVRGAALPDEQPATALNEVAPEPRAAVEAAAELAAAEEPAVQADPRADDAGGERAGGGGFPVVPPDDAQQAPVAAAPTEIPAEEPEPTATAVPTVAPEPTAPAADTVVDAIEAAEAESLEDAEVTEAAAEEQNTVPEEEVVAEAPQAAEEAAPEGDAVEAADGDTAETAANAEDAPAEAEEDIFTVYDIPVVGSATSGTVVPSPAPAPAPSAGSSASTFEQTVFVGPDGESLPALQSDRQQNQALFVRSGPSLESNLLALIDRRQQVTLLGRDDSSRWLKIRLSSGVEGWVDAAQSRAGVNAGNLPLAAGSVAVSAPAPAPVPASVPSSLPLAGTALVNSGAINVRSGPGVEYEPLTIVYGGREIGLLGRQTRGVWARVRLLDSGVEGWVNSTLLVPVGQILSLPAVP